MKRLATLEEVAGMPAEAAATLERINYIYPVKDEQLHRRLGELMYGQKQYDGAIREDIAVIALDPQDKAGAEFHLAQTDKAEESVLSSLEAAPDYRPAQKLLLEINQSPTKPN
jgi:tetratricopeptide (TPR) repeat protein